MPVHLRRPDDADFDRVLARCSTDHLSYEPTGTSLGGDSPPGFARRTWGTTLSSIDAFDRAVAALTDWEVHKRSGLSVRSDGPLAVGTNVAMIAPLPIGCAEVTCRVVAVIDEPERFGFAYGTLSVHPERGEEAFIVSHDGPTLRFEVIAVSQHAHPLARLIPWVANRMQDAAARRYLQSMQTLTAG